MFGRALIVCAACIAISCGAATLPEEMISARTKFEVALRTADQQGQERIAAVCEAYLQHLRVLVRQQQAKGRLRGLVSVRDEMDRFAKARIFPDKPVEDPVELRDAQGLFQFRLQQTQYSNEFAVVKLGEHYVQTLAGAREVAEESHADEYVRALDEECDRVVALARLRQALEATRNKPAGTPPKLSGGAAAAAGTNDSSRIRHVLDFYRPSNEALSSTLNYEARTVVYEDASQLKLRKTAGAGSTYRSLDGPVTYTPRITLSCRNGEIQSGSRLVIEYYSRSQPEHTIRRELVEKILLPRLERGKNHSIEAKSLLLNRSEQVNVVQYSGVSKGSFGAEFYGLILHLVDPDGKVLWQRFSPQALERELAAVPPEK